ncbi:MAG: hypothetical protein KBS41_01510 [Oscillospiraceae bacterium]|nr:hypothetical protein [Candidatus Equicaccousia limihippi]
MKTFMKILKAVGALGLICYDVVLIAAASGYENGGWLDEIVLAGAGLLVLLAVFSFAGGKFKKIMGGALMGVSVLNFLLRVVSVAASLVLFRTVVGSADYSRQIFLYYCASAIFVAAVFLCGFTAFKPHLYKAAGIVFAVSLVAFAVFYVWMFITANYSLTDISNYIGLLEGKNIALLPPAAILCETAVFIDLCFAKEVFND